jgi:DNA-binding SARP family transcriptional activator
MTTDPKPADFELFLLGGVELRGAADGADKLLAQSKAVALLAYLALSPAGRFQRRDTIVGLLWPELDQARARADLRKTVHSIRNLLGAEVIESRGDDELAVPSRKLWCDVVEFTAAADAGRLAYALELYRGELMPGFFLRECVDFERWLESERAAATERFAAASWAMAVAFEGERNYTQAGHWARRAVRHAWNDERVLRRVLSMLDRIGDRAGAMKLFDEFSTRLSADLGVRPSRETMELVDHIRAR